MTDITIFRKMLDPKNWGFDPECMLIMGEGEIYVFVTDHPEEERIHEALYHGGRWQ